MKPLMISRVTRSPNACAPWARLRTSISKSLHVKRRPSCAMRKFLYNLGSKSAARTPRRSQRRTVTGDTLDRSAINVTASGWGSEGSVKRRAYSQYLTQNPIVTLRLGGRVAVAAGLPDVWLADSSLRAGSFVVLASEVRERDRERVALDARCCGDGAVLDGRGDMDTFLEREVPRLVRCLDLTPSEAAAVEGSLTASLTTSFGM
jgi:hypothetical protein